MEHAKASCYEIFRQARSKRPRLTSWFTLLPASLVEPKNELVRVEPTVKVSSEYEGWQHMPAAVEREVSTRGTTYPRDYVLDYANMWPADLRATVQKLDATLGIRRDIRVERVAEILPFKVRRHTHPAPAHAFLSVAHAL